MISLRIIIGSLGVGGAEKHLCYILPYLRNHHDFKIKVITLSHHNDLADILEKNGIDVSKGHAWFRKSFVPMIVQRILNIIINITRLFVEFITDRRSITHFFLPQSYIMGGVMAKLTFLCCPLVMSRRSMNDYQKKYPIWAKIERYLHCFMALILGNSKAVVHQLIHEEHCDPQKTYLIYNGIDLKLFDEYQLHHRSRSNIRHDLNIGESDIVMIMVANFISYKGHKDLINALKMLSQKTTRPWHMLFVGRDDGIVKSLSDKVNRSDLSKNIRFLHNIKNIPALLMTCDIGVLSSHEEGFSNAVLEKMAAGLAMVVTDVGGNKEAVINDVNGYVVPPQSPQSMKEKILSLIEDDEQRRIMSENNKKRVREHFTIEKCGDEYARLYNELWNKEK